MIKVKIAELLGKHKWKQKDLAEKTDIRPSTISAYYQETIQRIDKEHLDKFCQVFNCSICDILEYVPDNK